jgi:hypothetical protein
MAVAALALLALAGCKGGGSMAFDYTSPFAPPAPTSSSVLSSFFVQVFSPPTTTAANTLLSNDPRYRQQQNTWSFTDQFGNPTSPSYASYPLRAAGVAFAHALGLTGAGSTITIVDAGFNTAHETIAGRVVASSNLTTAVDHGTKVASVAAGSSATMVGVAPGASLALGNYATGSTLANAATLATTTNSVAQVNSWGFTNAPVDQPTFDAIFGSPGGQAYFNALSGYAAQGVVVFAVSNDAKSTHSGVMEALPYLQPGLEAGWIAVGNAVPTLDATGTDVTGVSRLSSACLEAARWCVMADGSWLGATAQSNSSYNFSTGSSFAAPQVGGALALLQQAFPTLSPHDLRVRLLASADNSFAGFTTDGTVTLASGFSKRYSFEYGLGFLDVAAALLPIGPTLMSAPDGTTIATADATIIAGSGMGDAVTRSLSSVQIAVADSLGAGFSMPGAVLAPEHKPMPLSDRLAQRTAGRDFRQSRTAPAAAALNPFAAYSTPAVDAIDPDTGTRVTVLAPSASDGSFGLSLSRRIGGDALGIDVGMKVAHDGGSVIGFGTRSGQTGSNLAALTLGLTADSGTSFLTVGGEMGIADLASPDTLTRAGSARFNSVGLSLGGRDVLTGGDRLSVDVAMPVAVSSGAASMVVPVAMAAGTIESRSIAIDLAPSARQVDVGVTYQAPLGDRAELLVGLLHSENYGNIEGASDTAATLGLRFTF